MIDTDIYKAHTPAPWTVVCSIFAGRYYLTQAEERDAGDDEDCANADLMQDAPLILQALIDERAEVKRLREMYDNKLEELKSLRELNSLLCGKYEILEQLEGFDEILGLIG
jgi:hypothetical protein